jgi:hypothetical protein
MEDMDEDGIKEKINGFEKGLNEINLPDTSSWCRVLKKMIATFIGQVAGGAAIAIARFTAMELVTYRKVEEAEFGDKIAAFLHFGIHAAKSVPDQGPWRGRFAHHSDNVLVIGDQSREACLCVDSSFKILCDSGAINGQHNSDLRIKGDRPRSHDCIAKPQLFPSQHSRTRAQQLQNHPSRKPQL